MAMGRVPVPYVRVHVGLEAAVCSASYVHPKPKPAIFAGLAG